MDAILKQSLELLGLPLVAPEPEALAADLARIKCKTLANHIAAILNETEPLLKAEVDGTTVTVREIGDNAVLRFTVESEK